MVEHEWRKLQLVAGDVDGGAHEALVAVVVQPMAILFLCLGVLSLIL